MSRKGTVDVYQNKITRNDRFAQMSHQEMVIEQKKREIQAKIELKQKVPPATTTVASNQPAVKATKTATPSANLFNFNTFSNDGSFLDQFKQLKEKKPEARQKVFIKNSNNSKGLDKDKKSTDSKGSRWSGANKDSKARVSRFSERPIPQFDTKISISTTYANLISKNNFDTPPTVSNITNNVVPSQAVNNLSSQPQQIVTLPLQLISPQTVTGQPLLIKNTPTNLNVINPQPSLSDITLLSNFQQSQMNQVLSTINEISKNISVISTLSTTPMLLSVPPPPVNVLVSISEPPPVLAQQTALVNLTVCSNLTPDQHQQVSVLAPLPPPPLPSLPLPVATALPTLELSSIPPPNPIQLHNIPQPEPMNTLAIPPPAPLQVQNIPPPQPLQLTEIPNPKPLDLMNIPTPTEGLSTADFITSIPPPNKCIPPPNTNTIQLQAQQQDVTTSNTINVNVSIPPPTAAIVTLSCLPPNVSIPPPMQQPPTIQQHVMLPPPPQQARLIAATTPPLINTIQTAPTPIPALMAHPILPPPPPPTATLATQLLVQQQQVHQVAATTSAMIVGPPPLNMSCPPPTTAMLMQQQGLPAGVMGVGPTTFGRNINAVFTAGSVEFEAMAQMARVVARCGNSVQDVLLQRKPRDPDLWFLHQPHDSLVYRQYQQMVEQFRGELNNKVDSARSQQQRQVCNDNAQSNTTEDYRPEDIYDPDDAIAEEDDCAALGVGGPGFGSGPFGDNGSATESAEERRKRKRKSRWGDQGSSKPAVVSLPHSVAATQPATNPMLSRLSRTDPALLQYAQQTFGSTQLSEEDWKKAEDHYKINLLYQDMLRKRQEVERLQKAGRFKYDYDSDEEVDEMGPGTWEHKLREKEMMATNLWAEELTKQAEGKHHIGDFLPPEEYKKFMEKSQAVREGRTPDISDYKEFKLKEDNVGFKMLQKLGWSEGQGLGADGTGIVEPVNKSAQRDLNQGLGVGDDNLVANDDDEYDNYRKRMMLAYRFRPNPLNNPRRPYY